MPTGTLTFSTYTEQMTLDPGAWPPAQVRASVSDHHTIRLEQDGRSVFLTPSELTALVRMVEANS